MQCHRCISEARDTAVVSVIWRDSVWIPKWSNNNIEAILHSFQIQSDQLSGMLMLILHSSAYNSSFPVLNDKDMYTKNTIAPYILRDGIPVAQKDGFGTWALWVR